MSAKSSDGAGHPGKATAPSGASRLGQAQLANAASPGGGTVARLRDAGRAFTLIELLIVIVIILFLFGFLMELVGMARREASRSATLAVMHKVDTALRLFKTDFKVYPFAWSVDSQQSYPDLSAGQKLSNRLYYNLGTNISDANRQLVLADMDFAAAQYNYDCSTWCPDWSSGQEHSPVSVHTFITNRNDGKCCYDWWNNPEGDPVPDGMQYDNNQARYILNYESGMATCLLLNRMGQERARLLIFAGNVGACGVKMNDVPEPPSPYTHDGRDLSAIPLIPPGQRQSAAEPGWAMDYLDGELESRYISGENILDAYHQPLIYIYHVLPGARSAEARPFQSQTYIWDPQDYGLTTIGRKTLSTGDKPDLVPSVTAPGGALPDPNNLMHSDITAYAAPGYENEFELWSSGPDKQFTYMRDDLENRDNIPCENYNKAIP